VRSIDLRAYLSAYVIIRGNGRMRRMSLPTGRGTQPVRSCGLVRKRDNSGRQVERFEVLGACIIGGISTAYNNGEQHSHRKSAQSSICRVPRRVNKNHWQLLGGT
jgi:hypothetical protein